MEPINFCYWLKGYMELVEASEYAFPPLTHKQLQVINDHLNLVFTKKTQSYFDWVPNESTEDYGYQKLFTGHSGITAAGLC